MKHFTLPKDGGLIEKDLPADILHSYEKIPAEIYGDQEDASREIAGTIISAIKSHTGGRFRLGLTTGTTPVSLYRELSAKYKEGAISFANVEIFSIDEYYPVGKAEAQSRNHRLHEEFLNNVDVPKENIHIPDGTVPKDRITAYCAEYDKAISGLDLLVIGVGEQGQIGFNEAGSSEKSRTRTVLLSYKSRKAQSRNFNGNIADTPKTAITVGIATIMSAKKIILMAWGEDKAQAVKDIVEGPVTAACPASYLQKHENICFYADDNSASMLSRIVAPWLVGPCEWTPKFVRKAVAPLAVAPKLKLPLCSHALS